MTIKEDSMVDVYRSELYFRLLGLKCPVCKSPIRFDQKSDTIVICGHVYQRALDNHSKDPSLARFKFAKIQVNV